MSTIFHRGKEVTDYKQVNRGLQSFVAEHNLIIMKVPIFLKMFTSRMQDKSVLRNQEDSN